VSDAPLIRSTSSCAHADGECASNAHLSLLSNVEGDFHPDSDPVREQSPDSGAQELKLPKELALLPGLKLLGFRA